MSGTRAVSSVINITSSGALPRLDEGLSYKKPPDKLSTTEFKIEERKRLTL